MRSGATVGCSGVLVVRLLRPSFSSSYWEAVLCLRSKSYECVAISASSKGMEAGYALHTLAQPITMEQMRTEMHTSRAAELASV